MPSFTNNNSRCANNKRHKGRNVRDASSVVRELRNEIKKKPCAHVSSGYFWTRYSHSVFRASFFNTKICEDKVARTFSPLASSVSVFPGECHLFARPIGEKRCPVLQTLSRNNEDVMLADLLAACRRSRHSSRAPRVNPRVVDAKIASDPQPPRSFVIRTTITKSSS
jgi:hypothetical protein